MLNWFLFCPVCEESPMEQRRFSRVDFVINALVKYDDTAFRGEVENLSLRGIFIKSDRVLEIGTPAEITIGLTSVEPEIVIQVDATVVRVEEGGIGFQFAKLDVDSFSHLRSIISYRQGDADSIMDEFVDFMEQT